MGSHLQFDGLEGLTFAWFRHKFQLAPRMLVLATAGGRTFLRIPNRYGGAKNAFRAPGVDTFFPEAEEFVDAP